MSIQLPREKNGRLSYTTLCISEEILEVLDHSRNLPNACLRISKSGTPHVLVEIGQRVFSVCWFSKHKFYRVFWPYPNDKQDRRDFASVLDVHTFLKNCLKEYKNG